MILEHDRCYRAVTSRDARFDGQFVTAVRTTGIYCRPSCPAVTPKRTNVEFWPTAAAAQLRGFRACRRCLPDAVPGSPDWNVRADLAARAMRLIGDGVVERDGVPGLATRLGYSERQLGRVLSAELGAGPLALARAHRAHTARLLVETTPMAMADVAFASGFASVRQFNDTVREVYGVPPTTLRAEAGRRAIPAATGAIVLRLPYRPPFDAAGLLTFFAARAVAGVEQVDGGTYRRTMRLPRGPATVELALAPAGPDGPAAVSEAARRARGNAVTRRVEASHPAQQVRRSQRGCDGQVVTHVPASRRQRGSGKAGDTHVVATLRLSDPRDLAPAVARLRRLLDLDADPVAVDAVLGADPVLASSVAAVPGIRLPGTVDPAETALRAVLGQQVSVAAARTAAARLADTLGERLPPALAGDGPDLLFPTAATVAGRGAEVLTGPARRTASIVGLAAALSDGTLVLDAGRDAVALRADLVALPGIGPWSAGYLAIRVLGDPDELLPDDLAVRRGARALGIDDLPRHATRWAPWRSYAALHLWGAASLIRRSA